MITSFYRTRDGRGGSVSLPPFRSIENSWSKKPKLFIIEKRNLSEINIILFKYLENISISRFYGWFSVVWKKLELLEYRRAIYLSF